VVDVHVASDARGGVELSVDGRQGRMLLPGEGVRIGAAPTGWEVPCIARPTRKKKGEAPTLVSVSEEFILQAIEDGGPKNEEVEGEEPAGGWVEDLNGLLGFNKGFRGRYVDVHHEEE
jgi:hypothetical protein